MKYFLFETQYGGCDYSIGCGYRLREIPGASSLAEAMQIVCRHSQHPDEDPQYGAWIQTDGEQAIAKAQILEVSGSGEVDLASLQAERQAIRKRLAEETKAKQEQAEYERLKRKFEGQQ